MLASKKIQINHDLTNRACVFEDRKHAGEILAEMLKNLKGTDALLLAIPSGGVSVAIEVATRLDLELDILPVSKILFPWTTESGFGAVAFDETKWLNEEAINYYDLDEESVTEATRQATDKIQRRIELFHTSNAYNHAAKRIVILVDDGIASGYTMRVGIEALQKSGAGKIIIAVPTASSNSLDQISPMADMVYCANVRAGYHFAVADAYRHWTDVDEKEAVSMFSDYVTKSSARFAVNS